MPHREAEQPHCATLTNIAKPNGHGLILFLKGHQITKADGTNHITLMDGQESFMTQPFLTMNSWAAIPEEIEKAKKGSILAYYPIAL